jgi:hypothetical protein
LSVPQPNLFFFQLSSLVNYGTTGEFFSSFCPLWELFVTYHSGLLAGRPVSWAEAVPILSIVPSGERKVCDCLLTNDDVCSCLLADPESTAECIYLFPQENVTEIEVAEASPVPEEPVSSFPSTGVLATIAGGALGLGFSVTKLLS